MYIVTSDFQKCLAMARLPPLFRNDATVATLRGFQQRTSPLVHASPNSALIAVGGAVSCVGELLGETSGVR